MPVSFAKDIAPLFSAGDRFCMSRRGVLLDDYGYMSDPSGDGSYPDHARVHDVLAHLTGEAQPQMPLGAPAWPDEKIGILRQWITDGFAA